jgi:UDP-N-acetyl-D-galactosamine dehydrogenase
VIDVINGLRSYGIEPVVVDPWVDPLEAQTEYGLEVATNIPGDVPWAAVIAAVAHRQFAELQQDAWQGLLSPDTVVFDLKGLVPRSLATLRL